MRKIREVLARLIYFALIPISGKGQYSGIAMPLIKWHSDLCRINQRQAYRLWLEEREKGGY